MVSVGSSFNCIPFHFEDNISSLQEAMRFVIEGEEDPLYNELWYACAGPNANIPTTGEKVMYFPQGHLKQIEAFTNHQETMTNIPTYNLPSEIPCRVIYVQLKVEADTDEVFAQISLRPEIEEIERGENFRIMPQRTSVKSFNKIVTTSDTSTHGGFSVHRRHAQECFPPLNMDVEPPTQTLMAKDLHGVQWEFRHVYRGSPKRHLLSGGWGSFVSTKEMVAGDTFVFLGGENGEFRAGIRRLKRPNSISGILSTYSMKLGVLATAFHAISTRTLLDVFYQPRLCLSEFVVLYNDYIKSTTNRPSIGMKFKWKFTGDQCTEESLIGRIIAIQPQDPINWPCSKWKCLKVKWDGPSSIVRPDRLSPWEIEQIHLDMIPSLFPILPKKARSSRAISTALIRDGESQALVRPVPHQPKKQQQWLSWPSSSDWGQSSQMTPENQNDFQMQVHFQSRNLVSGTSTSQPKGTSSMKLFGADITKQQGVTGSESDAMGSNSIVSECISEKQCARCANHLTNIKVQKYGVSLGRSIDLTKLSGYEELIKELDMNFDFKGALVDGNSGWQVIYTDIEGDIMLVEESTWPDFPVMVKKMIILPREEVDKLSPSNWSS